MNKAVGLLTVLLALTLTSPALAQGQRVRRDLIERSRWYQAPREYQIIDDRPVIRDFREAPQQAGTVELPPGPSMGAGGGAGGSGSGALPAGVGSSIPGDGVHLGGPNTGSRPATGGLTTLPRAGFGGNNSNMSSYHAPAKAMPTSYNTGVLGKMLSPARTGSGSPRGLSASRGRMNGNYNGPAVSTYNGGYGRGSGPAWGSASRTETRVRGSLLKGK